MNVPEPLLESEFQRSYAKKTLPVVRVGLIFGVLLLAAFAVLDQRSDVTPLRFAIAVGILLGAFAGSFHRTARRRVSWLVGLVLVTMAALLLLTSGQSAGILLFGTALLAAFVVPRVLEAAARRDFSQRRQIRNDAETIEEKTRALDEALVALEKAQNDLLQAERMAAVGRRVSGLMHELSSPLGVLRAGADITESALTRLERSDDALPKRMRQAVAEAHRASFSATERLSAIVNGLRSFTRRDRARFDLVDLNEGLEDALILLAPELHGGIAVRRKLGEIPKVVCQPSEVNLVLLHVLHNAARAIESSGTITLETFCEDGVVSVRVTDDGRGIDPDVLKLLFVPPVRRTETSAPAGVGLFLSHQIVERHGGRILVASETGRGTSVTIKLPREQPPGVA